MPLLPDYNDIVGKQFGELTVIEFCGFKPTNASPDNKFAAKRLSYYKCKCSCGKEKEIARADLLRGGNISCGDPIHRTKVDEYVGKTLGNLEVLEFVGFKYRSPNSKTREAYYKCKCLVCGKICEKPRAHLRAGYTQSCGCKNQHKDLTGQKFGRLTAICRMPEDFYDSNHHKRIMYKCKCECGNEVILDARVLQRGVTQSCGCLRVEKLLQRTATQNRLSNTRLYSIWRGMNDRCYNKDHQAYSYYGGSGITICDRWQTFLNFYEDMHDSYWEAVEKYGDESTVTIDRIDGTKGYSFDNCRWISRKEQMLNISSNRIVNVYGKEMPVLQATNLYAAENVSYEMVLGRLNRGMDIYDALFTENTKHRDHGKGTKPLEFLRPDQDWRTAYTEDEIKGFTN